MLDLFARPAKSSTSSSGSTSSIRIKTIVRKAVASSPSGSPSSHANSPSSTAYAAKPAARNALPEHKRVQIEREARERAAAKERAEAGKASAAAARTSLPKSLPKSSTSSPAPPRQRKAGPSNASLARKKRVRPTLGSDDDEEHDDDAASASSRSTSKAQRRGKTHTPVPGTPRGGVASPISAYKKLGRAGVESEYRVPRDAVIFSPSQEQMQVDEVEDSAQDEQPLQSVGLVSHKFGPYFKDLGVNPTVSLEYPSGRTEEFTLLVPRDRDEYDPLSDLLRAVRATVTHYLEPSYVLEHFGPLSALEFSSAAGSVLPNLSLPGASSLGSPLTRNSSPSTESGVSTPVASGAAAQVEEESILRSLTKARNRRDGALFIRSVERYNAALRAARESGVLKKGMEELCTKGLPEDVWGTILQQCYDRTVGPRVDELGRYEAFSDNVYGELLPRFMSEIAQLCKLGPDSTFVDLGSGVSNLALQVALQTGATARGVEMMGPVSELGELQVREAERRTQQLWSLKKVDLQTWKGDFTACERTRVALCAADVVLVNNYAFTAKTNERLSLLFLDLKDGAKVVSLKPFVPHDFRLTERTLDSPLAILSVEQRDYSRDCVSWADSGGRYFIHTVDRSMIQDFYSNQGTSQRSTGRSRGAGSKKAKKPRIEAADTDSK